MEQTFSLTGVNLCSTWSKPLFHMLTDDNKCLVGLVCWCRAHRGSDRRTLALRTFHSFFWSSAFKIQPRSVFWTRATRGSNPQPQNLEAAYLNTELLSQNLCSRSLGCFSFLSQTFSLQKKKMHSLFVPQGFRRCHADSSENLKY